MNTITAGLRRACVALLATAAAAAHAEVKQASPDAFFIAFSAHVAAAPAKAYASLTQVQNWWSGEHTWSGKAANLSLKAEVGACFCERWPAGSAEHGRVIMALPDHLLRLDAALGPLQEFALKGILSFWIKPGEGGGSEVSLEYRVNGSSASGLDDFAPKVDEVLGAQFDRLTRYVDTGNADGPAPAKPAAPRAGPDPAVLAEWAKEAAQETSGAKAPAAAAPKKKPTAPKPTDGGP